MKTKMSSRAVLLAIFLTLLAAAAGRAAENPAEAVAQAQKAAESWLALVDQGQHAKSWEEAASLFRGAVGKDAWVSAVGGVRGQVGKLKSRQLKSAQYATSLPGAPAGQYVVIQYDAVFANRPAVETVTPMLDKDGTWRVSGYYVR
jgi:hypothetical protein